MAISPRVIPRGLVWQQLSLDGVPLPKMHEVAALFPGETVTCGEMRIPLADVLPLRAGAVTMFAPLARFLIEAERGDGGGFGDTHVFTLGLPSQRRGDTMQPFRLDLGPRRSTRSNSAKSTSGAGCNSTKRARRASLVGMDSLVSTDGLAHEMGSADLRIVDASYHLADTGRSAADEYAQGHIPRAIFLDLAGFADPDAAIENTMPGADLLAARMEALGIYDDSRIVLYDDSAIKSATRAWYMLRMFGAREVSVLDGGLGKWKAEGRPW